MISDNIDHYNVIRLNHDHHHYEQQHSLMTEKQSTDIDSALMLDKVDTCSEQLVTQDSRPMVKKRKAAHLKDIGRSARKGKKQKTACHDEVEEEKQAHEDEEASSGFGYIHVRARRGQATDSHSLAERVRREKISERMQLLQALVPGCDKFLSAKLASVDPAWYSFGVDEDAVMLGEEEGYFSTMPMSLPMTYMEQLYCTTTTGATFIDSSAASIAATDIIGNTATATATAFSRGAGAVDCALLNSLGLLLDQGLQGRNN
ncbi:hypothetical protein Dimus_023660 [Dionaea muscipula]